MVAKVYTGTTNGIEGILVCVEADISDGLPMFDMVGYLGAEVKEARERVRTALKKFRFSTATKPYHGQSFTCRFKKAGQLF